MLAAKLTKDTVKFGDFSVSVCKMHHYCSGENGVSITTSGPHLELTATWLYTISEMFYEHLYINNSLLK